VNSYTLSQKTYFHNTYFFTQTTKNAGIRGAAVPGHLCPSACFIIVTTETDFRLHIDAGEAALKVVSE
jgi:hypothetical protein